MSGLDEQLEQLETVKLGDKTAVEVLEAKGYQHDEQLAALEARVAHMESCLASGAPFAPFTGVSTETLRGLS